MTIARDSAVETFLASGTVANNATGTGTAVDILGDNTSEGYIDVYLTFTSTVTAGSIDVKLWPSDTTGGSEFSDDAPIVGSFAPKNGTKHCFVGTFLAQRKMNASATNNATGANATSLSITFILVKRS